MTGVTLLTRHPRGREDIASDRVRPVQAGTPAWSTCSEVGVLPSSLCGAMDEKPRAGEAERLGHAMDGARLPLLPRAGPQLHAAAANDRRLRRRAAARGRGTVLAEATRLYSAGLGARQRALDGALVSGVTQGEVLSRQSSC